MDRRSDASMAYEQGKIKAKYDPTRKLFENNDNSHQSKEENIIREKFPEFINIEENTVKKFLAKAEKAEYLDTLLSKTLQEISRHENNKKYYENKLVRYDPNLYQQLIQKAQHLKENDPDNSGPLSTRLDKAFETLYQENLNNADPQFLKFSEKFGALVRTCKSLEKLEKSISKIQPIAESKMAKLAEHELCKSVGSIDNLIQRIRDIKASASAPNTEIHTIIKKMQDDHDRKMKEILDNHNTEIQKILDNHNTEIQKIFEKHGEEIQKLKVESEQKVKELMEEVTKLKQELNKKSSSGFFKKLTNILNKIKDWLKKPFAKNDQQLEGNVPPNDQPTKFGRVKKVFKGIGEFLRKVAQYTGLLRFARTFPYRYRHNSTWGKIGKGTLEVLGGIGLAGGVYMIPFYIYKTAKYNHKDVMHQKYDKDTNSSYYKGKQAPKISYILKHEATKTEFYIREGIAKDRELSFLTRHPIPEPKKEAYKGNPAGYVQAKEEYETKKKAISNLTKAQVKDLRKSFERQKSQDIQDIQGPNGWTIKPYKEEQPHTPENQPKQ